MSQWYVHLHIPCNSLSNGSQGIGQTSNGFCIRRVIHHLLGEYSRAQQDYETAIHMDDNYDAWFNLGVYYCDRRQLEKSLECFQKAVLLKSSNMGGRVRYVIELPTDCISNARLCFCDCSNWQSRQGRI